LFGKCNICGSDTAFYYQENESFRESLFCINCRTISRYRSIARGILFAIRDLAHIDSSSISELPGMHDHSLRIYDTQVPFYGLKAAYPVPDLLSKCKWIDVESSVYKPNRPLGAKLHPHRTNQNIEKLTFPDSNFDIVITSDVMEHVRLDDRAHQEIRRILKPGGVYLFTVPSIRNGETQHRVHVRNPQDPTQDQFLLDKEFHDDPNIVGERSLTYRIYGTDLDTKLMDLGFVVQYEWQNIAELGILETELFYCTLQKT
jgi:SAM-dependent methyltransferase